MLIIIIKICLDYNNKAIITLLLIIILINTSNNNKNPYSFKENIYLAKYEYLLWIFDYKMHYGYCTYSFFTIIFSLITEPSCNVLFFIFQKHIFNFTNAWIQYTWAKDLLFIELTSPVIVNYNFIENYEQYEMFRLWKWSNWGLSMFRYDQIQDACCWERNKIQDIYIIVISICFSNNTYYSLSLL